MSEVENSIGSGEAPTRNRMTFNLTDKAAASLDRLVEASGLNKTDSVNRAIRLSDAVEQIAPDGRLRIIGADGQIVELLIL